MTQAVTAAIEQGVATTQRPPGPPQVNDTGTGGGLAARASAGGVGLCARTNVNIVEAQAGHAFQVGCNSNHGCAQAGAFEFLCLQAFPGADQVCVQRTSPSHEGSSGTQTACK